MSSITVYHWRIPNAATALLSGSTLLSPDYDYDGSTLYISLNTGSKITLFVKAKALTAPHYVIILMFGFQLLNLVDLSKSLCRYGAMRQLSKLRDNWGFGDYADKQTLLNSPGYISPIDGSMIIRLVLSKDQNARMSRYVYQAENIYLNPDAKPCDMLADLYRSRHLSDITIIAENQRFDCHRVILANRSAYFRMRFDQHTTFQDCGYKVTDVDLDLDVCANTFDILLEYIYTGEIKFVSADLAIDLLDCFIVAKRLLIIGFAESILICSLNIGICFEAAVITHDDTLYARCVAFSIDFIEELALTDVLLDVTSEVIQSIIKAHTIEVMQSIIKAYTRPDRYLLQLLVCRWLVHNPDQPVPRECRELFVTPFDATGIYVGDDEKRTAILAKIDSINI